MTTESGETVSAIYDSGALNCVIESSLLKSQRNFINRRLSHPTTIEIVGGLEQTKTTYKVLLPLEDCSEDYQMTSAVSVPQIVTPIPKRDLSEVMTAAYQAYVVQCTNLGTVPIDQTFWPKGQYGGFVEVLLGIGDLSFEVIFNYKGLFSSHIICHRIMKLHGEEIIVKLLTKLCPSLMTVTW